MTLYFILGAAGLAGLLWMLHWYSRAPAADLARAVRTFFAVAGTLASMGLVFAGRFGMAAILLIATVAAVWTLVRKRPEVGTFGGETPRGRTSEVETATLHLVLNHETGELEGEVVRGAFSGRALTSLGLAELLELLDDCTRHDPDSVALLETYLDRNFPDWHGDAAAGGRKQAGAGDGEAMDEAQALEILGLEAGAGIDEIKAAHRRLMNRLHPDHGGSTYLAAQINRAKDLLIRRAERARP